jgi:DNA polymerase
MPEGSEDTMSAGRQRRGIAAIAAQTGAYLEGLREGGVRHVQARPEVVRALSDPPARRPSARGSRRVASGVVEGLAGIAGRIAACRLCRLCSTRTQTVPGQGHPAPEIMFIGEGPGADEDAQGLAFVGRAGQLLTKIIEAMGFTRDQVFIGNIVKCRPPENRAPMPDEMQSCLPFLHEQVALLKPKVIVALGATAVKGLFGDDKIGITKLRGRWMTYQGIDVMPTYHPAYLLRNSDGKKDVWQDMQEVLKRLGRKPPAASSGGHAQRAS